MSAKSCNRMEGDMGIRIFLTAKGADITPEFWERVYNESLVLLDSFPARLTRLEAQKIGDEKRYVYTPDIVRKRDTPAEHWTVSGDMTTRQEAESFDLCRHHASQFADEYGSGDSNGYDVLWAEPDDEFEDFYGNGRLLWDSKTQGCLYHIAILAVGMLIESRCPRSAYVIGDIDRSQAEQAKEWADALLEKPIDLPVCVDADRLFRRTLEMYTHERQAFRRFSTLFRGEPGEVWPAIVRNVESSGVRECLIEGLEDFESIGSRGASENVIGYLEATGDIAGLIETVGEITSRGNVASEEYSIEALLRSLCAYSVTIPLEERTLPRPVGLPPLPADESDEDSWKTFVTLALSLPTTEFYIPADQLLEHFSKTQPLNRERFKKMIKKRETKAREDRRWLSKKIGEFDRTDASAEPETSNSEPPLSVEEQLRAEIASQTRRYPDQETLARETGAMLRNGILLSLPVDLLRDRDAMLRAMYRASWENQIVLTAPSWERIDALQNLEVLRHLVGLASVPSTELHFWNWRRHLLERPDLWVKLLGPFSVQGAAEVSAPDVRSNLARELIDEDRGD